MQNSCFKRGVGLLIAASLALFSTLCAAGEADVISVNVTEANGRFSFAATVRHADEGWEHYADSFEVVGPDGTVLATRVLAHPHVEEQPFTRSLSGVEVPPGISSVTIRASDSVHGFGGAEIKVTLPGR